MNSNQTSANSAEEQIRYLESVNVYEPPRWCLSIGPDVDLYRKIFNQIRALGTLHPQAANHVIRNLHKTFDLIYKAGFLDILVTDDESFDRITFFLAVADSWQDQFMYAHIFLSGIRNCPKAAMKHFEFYSRFLDVDSLEAVMNAAIIPKPAEFADSFVKNIMKEYSDEEDLRGDLLNCLCLLPRQEDIIPENWDCVELIADKIRLYVAMI